MIKNEGEKKTIHLTFDYELFFAKSGTLQKCLLEPTDRLLSIFREHDIKGTFFIDVLYYLRLLESKTTQDDARKIKQQLQNIVAQGSRIELHLHPHWLDACYVDGRWEFTSYDNYRLHSLKEAEITHLFINGVHVIEEIAKEIKADYKVKAFRAGGYCLQPFAKLRQGFLKSGIQIDSSVAPGMVGKSDPQRFDFSMAPDQSFYVFSDDPMRVHTGGEFFELPITTYRKKLAAKVLLKLISKCNGAQFKTLGDGRGLHFPITWWRKLLPSVRMFTLDGEMLPYELSREVARSKRQMITIISHPKLLSPISFKCLKRLIKDCHNFVEIEEAFHLLQQSE